MVGEGGPGRAGVLSILLLLSVVASPALAAPATTDGPSAQHDVAAPLSLETGATPTFESVEHDPGERTAAPAAASHTATRSSGTEALAETRSPTSPTISSYLSSKLVTSNAKVPVLIVFETQPSDAFDLDRLSEAQARDRMQSLARTEQRRAATYLRQQAQRGRATVPKRFWVRNAIAVAATPETVREVARLEHVDRIVYDRKITPLGSEPATVSAFTDTLGKYGTLTAPSGFERAASGDRAWHVDYIGADAVQEHGVTGEGVNVSVIDTGIDAAHPALTGQVVRWKDFSVDNHSTPVDPNGHGTHVAGLVAGKRDASHATGIAPGANLYGAKVFSDSGEGRLSDLISAFEWSAEQDADVISASIGVPPITDLQEGATLVEQSTTTSTNITIYHNASSLQNDSSDIDAAAYEPASAMVMVEPTARNGTAITNESVKAAVMANVTVSFVSPAGTTPLTPIEASWVYENGDVPDQLAFYKYKPTGNTSIQAAGNWSLQVSSANAGNVTLNYSVAPIYPTNGSDHLAETVDTLATSENVVPVIAAGNYGYVFGNRSVTSPGAAEHAITVGASGYRTNDVAMFSSRGPVAYGSDTRPGIDVIAPGVDVLSAYPTAKMPDGTQPYATLSGTSMATPQVSGTVALLLAANPSMTRDEVESTLEATAQPVPGGTVATGAGVVDAWAAVNRTAPDALADTASTESGVVELYAGLGNTADERIYAELQPVTDPSGDSGQAPDLRASTTFIDDDLELAMHDGTPRNGTFRVYIDIDQNDSTGASDASGADYRIVLNRTYTNGSYNLTTRFQAYNASTTAFERTDSVSVFENERQTQETFVGLWDIDFRDYDDPVTFDWHITAAPLGGQPGDRLPDAGQVATGGIQKSLTGVAVAWNASAGHAITGAPIEFTAYNQQSGAIETTTTTTDSVGRANATLPVTANASHDEFTLEIADMHNNTITQTYQVSDACVECLVEETGPDGLHIETRGYTARPNETVTLTIPIYNASNDQLVPYTGPVSLRLDDWSSDSPIVKNNLTTEDGIVEATIDLSNTTADESDTYLTIDGSLTETYDNGQSMRAASIEIQDQPTEVTTAPRTTVVAPGRTTSLSFQSVDTQTQDPVNESVEYTTLWITDRYVASLYSQLPAETVQTIKDLRRQSLFEQRGAGSQLSAADRQALRAAMRNLSKTQGFHLITRNGTATPTAHGVGTLDVTPVDDSRIGIVFAHAPGSDRGSFDSLVFVDSRIDRYRDTQTEPTESDRYELRVWSDWDDWGSHVEDGYRVPNDTYTVRVSLYDEQTDSLVDGATVNLYSVSGGHRTVTTNGSQPVTVSMQAPDLDWPNVSYAFRDQQVLAIADGYTTSSGAALTARESLYGDVEEVERQSGTVVEPHPELTYDNESLEVEIEYRNESSDPVNGTRTLVMLGSPDGWFDIQRDYLAAFVDPGTQTTYRFNVSDDTPPGPSEPRQFEVLTRTGSMDENTMWVGFASVGGGTVSVDAPNTVYAGQQANVTLRLESRNGTPVSGAALAFHYQVYTDTTGISGPDGGTRIAVANASGEVTIPITPDLPTDVGNGWLQYEVGYATANVSRSSVESGWLAVQESQPVELNGTIEYPGGQTASGDTVVVAADSVLGYDVTDSNGAFTISTTADRTQDVRFFQGNYTDGEPSVPVRDGVPDLYAVDRVTPTTNTTLGATRLPNASVLNVTVVNESDAPVPNATIMVTHVDTASGASASLTDQATTADGMFQLETASNPGIEVNGTIEITVTPPSTAAYVQQTYTRMVTVNGSTDGSMNETVGLEETGKVTVNGTVVGADDTPAANDDLRFVEVGGSATTISTDDSGAFAGTLNGSSTYTVGFYQVEPRNDSIPDVEALPVVSTGATSTDIGPVSLPTGHTLNVTVVNESGDPVENASVRVVDWNGSHHAGYYFGTGTMETDANGLITPGARSDPGIDLAGNVTVFVAPPANAGFVDTTYTRNLTVTAPDSITVELNESSDTGSGDGGGTGGGGSANLSVTDPAVDDTVVATGSTVAINATVVNTGDASGTLTVSFTKDRREIHSEDVTVAAGGQEPVAFEHTFNSPGTYTLSVNGDAFATVDVLEPFVGVQNATLVDDTITADSNAVVDVVVANNNSTPTSVTVNLSVNGSRVASRTVDLNATESKTIQFERDFDTPGTYTISVNGQDLRTLTVEATETTSADTPGFGVVPALVAMLGAGFVLRRRRR